jgi:hypothetical protein
LDNPNQLHLLRAPHPTEEERRLQSLVRFTGLEPEGLVEPLMHDLALAPIHVASTCQSLGTFWKQPGARAWLAQRLAVDGSTLFLTGIGASPQHLQTLADLLPGVVQAVVPMAASDASYRVTKRRDSGMRQFSSLAFGGGDRAVDGVFVLGEQSGAEVVELVGLSDRPCYVRVRRGAATYYLLACERVLDLDAAAEPGQQPIDRFLQFVPLLAYLRSTFGAQCWTNERPAACFIIDDPLLKTQYGFIEFDRLEALIARSRSAMNIAFIPWNCRRTDRRVAEKFTRSDHRLSISVHGCDHTEAEFGTTDAQRLRRQARRALSRMDLHRELTGIEHNRVMVFPQGVFSRKSLEALHDEGFLAAVNSTVHPVDGAQESVTFRDLLDVAVLRFGGVPLFMRHYPDRLEKFALDLFLGKQLLIVEHHGLFRDGYEKAERYVNFLNTIAPEVTWTDLESLCTSATLVRELPAGGVQLRAFGPLVRVKNQREYATHVRISNDWARERLESVTWNGRVIDHQTDGSATRCELHLEAGEEGTLNFQRGERREAFEPFEATVKERVKVFVRRHLSEVRDNYLDRRPWLSELAKVGKTLLLRM